MGCRRFWILRHCGVQGVFVQSVLRCYIFNHFYCMILLFNNIVYTIDIGVCGRRVDE